MPRLPPPGGRARGGRRLELPVPGRRPDPPRDVRGHAGDLRARVGGRMIGLLLLAACGVPPERATSPNAILPHPPGYGDTAEPHGADALATGATCFACHAVEN